MKRERLKKKRVLYQLKCEMRSWNKDVRARIEKVSAIDSRKEKLAKIENWLYSKNESSLWLEK